MKIKEEVMSDITLEQAHQIMLRPAADICLAIPQLF